MHFVLPSGRVERPRQARPRTGGDVQAEDFPAAIRVDTDHDQRVQVDRATALAALIVMASIHTNV